MCIFYSCTVILPTPKAIAVKPKQTPKATLTPSPGIVLPLVQNHAARISEIDFFCLRDSWIMEARVCFGYITI